MRRSLVLLLMALTLSVSAQNELDALRYSQINVVGTARYAAMGGAFGALGGDMTTLSVNPAGIGVFTKSTGSVTMSVFSSSTDARYLSTTSSDNKVNFNFPNAGFVVQFRRKRGEEKQWAWKAFHLGVAYNRTANFHRRTSVIGTNTSSSSIDAWVDQLNNSGLSYPELPTENLVPGAELTNAFMGWGTFLIDTVPGAANAYRRNVLPGYGQTEQVREVTKGAMGEGAISFGGNFGNALYVGATIGIPRISYEVERNYTESDAQDTISNFASFTRSDYLQATGTGFNLKFGLIYRPVKWLRLGAAIHSPTWMEMDEVFKTVLVTNAFSTTYSQSTLDGAFDYRLQTPFRAIGSLGFVVGTIGVISADYEYVNYALARFRSRGYSFDTENANVQNRLNWAGNIRIGTEWRLGAVSLRGGFAINGNPYKVGYSFDDTRYSLGAGYRLERFFIDLAYMLNRTVGNYEMYDVSYTPLAETVTLDHSVIATVGFRF